MFGPLTRAQMRDQIRRELGQTPPIDDGAGAAGAQPTRWPEPTNIALNLAIDKAAAWLSRKCPELSGEAVPLEYAVAAQTDSGPFRIALFHIAPQGSVTAVRRASWRPTGGSATLLTPVTAEELDRARDNWESEPPSTPTRYWVAAGELLLSPAPAAPGDLLLILGRSLWTAAQTADDEVMDFLPADHYPTFIAQAAAYVCMAYLDDPEYVALLKGLSAQVADGLGDLERFLGRRSRRFAGRVTAAVGRLPWGGR